MKKKETVFVLQIPVGFQGVIDRRKKKSPTIQFYEWVMSQMGKPIDKEGVAKVHVSEVCVTSTTGKMLFDLEKRAIEKELGRLYTDKKIASEVAFFWLAYGPNETITDGHDGQVYLTKDWYK